MERTYDSNEWVENVVEVKRLSERLMLIRISKGTNILNVISVYAPQLRRRKNFCYHSVRWWMR